MCCKKAVGIIVTLLSSYLQIMTSIRFNIEKEGKWDCSVRRRKSLDELLLSVSICPAASVCEGTALRQKAETHPAGLLPASSECLTHVYLEVAPHSPWKRLNGEDRAAEPVSVSLGKIFPASFLSAAKVGSLWIYSSEQFLYEAQLKCSCCLPVILQVSPAEWIFKRKHLE